MNEAYKVLQREVCGTPFEARVCDLIMRVHELERELEQRDIDKEDMRLCVERAKQFAEDERVERQRTEALKQEITEQLQALGPDRFCKAMLLRQSEFDRMRREHLDWEASKYDELEEERG